MYIYICINIYLYVYVHVGTWAETQPQTNWPTPLGSGVSHVTRMNESGYVTRENGSCHTHRWVMSYMGRSHGRNAACHTWKWVSTHLLVNDSANTTRTWSELCHTYECDTPHVRTSHVTNEIGRQRASAQNTAANNAMTWSDLSHNVSRDMNATLMSYNMNVTHESCHTFIHAIHIVYDSYTSYTYGLATISRLLKFIGLFCKRAL